MWNKYRKFRDLNGSKHHPLTRFFWHKALNQQILAVMRSLFLCFFSNDCYYCLHIDYLNITKKQFTTFLKILHSRLSYINFLSAILNLSSVNWHVLEKYGGSVIQHTPMGQAWKKEKSIESIDAVIFPETPWWELKYLMSVRKQFPS